MSFAFQAHAADGDYVWAKHMGGTSSELGHSVAVDSSGNVYTAGVFTYFGDFDPGAGTANLGSMGGWDVFVSKLDSSGNHVWAKSIGGSNDDFCSSVAVDSSGNVYLVGNFGGTADFDPGLSTTNLTAAGSQDGFVCKLDSAGSFVWAKQLGGTGSSTIATSVAIDSSGNVFTTGFLTGTADFDPGAGTANLTAAGNEDIFISKLDSSGNYVWAKRLGGSGFEFAYSLALDSSANVYTTGYFLGTADFDPGAGTVNLASDGYDFFVSKLDSAGNYVWAKKLSGSNGDATASSVAVDSSGNIYTTGIFIGTADFDPGLGTANLTSGYWDTFVSKLDNSGNYVWAKKLGGNGSEGNSVAVDLGGNVYTSGSFEGTGDFDPGPSTASLTSTAYTDIFVSKLDSLGNYVWAKRMGAFDFDYAYSVAVDLSGNVYTTGDFYGTVDFDPGAGTANIASYGFSDIFVSKLSGPPPPGVLSVTRAGSSPTNAASVDYTVVFNQSVSGVDASDFSVTPTGVSGANITGVSGSGTTYTVNVNTGSGDGTLRLDVIDDDTIVNGVSLPLGGAGAGNGNYTAGQVYTIDHTSPTITLISSASDPTKAAITVNVSLSEASINFTLSDVTGTNASVSGFSGAGTSYSFTLTPSAQGAFSAVVDASKFTDLAGNNNTVSNTLDYTYDSIAPTITLSSTASNPTNGAITVTATLSETSTNFASADVFPINASVSNFSGSGTSYSFTLTPSGQGLFYAIVSASKFTDAAGNNNTTSNLLSYTYDSMAPTITLSSSASNPANGAITVTAAPSEASSNFVAGDITATNAAVSDFGGGGTSYSFTLTPSAQGAFSAVVNAASFADAAGNSNTASNTLDYIYDSVAPTITLSSSDPNPTNGAITVAATLSETSSDFANDDVTPTNASVTNFSGSGTSYTFTLTPSALGVFSAVVNASMFTDAAGNNNTASNTLDYTYDAAPTADSITPATASPTNSDNVSFDVTFSEDVQYFDAVSDLVIFTTGTVTYSGATFSGGPQVYSVSVDGVDGDGTLALAVSTGSDVQDTAAFALQSSVTSSAVTIDNTAPSIAVDTLSATTGTPTVTGTAADASGIVMVSVKIDETVYEASTGGSNWSVDVTSTLTDGAYNVSATATDLAGNSATDGTNNELSVSAADGNSLCWAVGMGGTGSDKGFAIAVDGSGNVYTTGHFQGTVDFDPGAGTANLTSAGSNDIFVQKLDTNGNLVWARSIGGTGTDQGYAIAVDDSGNVLVTGYFQGTADFDPSAGTTNLTSAGSSDVFVIKLDSSGSLVWARAVGGTGPDESRGIAVDSTGNVVITGYFQATADLDPGAGTLNFVSNGSDDIFVLKLDSNGILDWVKAVGGTSQDRGLGITIDESGNVVSTGAYMSTVDFDPGSGTANLTSLGNFDIYVQKLDTGGNFVWAKSMSGTAWNIGRGIITDNADNIFLAGSFQGTVDFDPDAGTTYKTGVGNNEIFVQKLDSTGGLVWVKTMTGTDDVDDTAYSIALDPVGDVYIGGNFGTTEDFDPDSTVANRTSSGSADVFVQKLGTNGSLVWIKSMGGTGSDIAYGVGVDAIGNVYTAGYFSGSADFDPSDGANNLNSAGAEDAFVTKLCREDSAAPAVISITPSTTGPTNATDVDFIVEFSEAVTNFDAAGDLVISHTGTANSGVTITGGPKAYTVTVNGITGSGSFTLAVDTTSDVQDMVGNALVSSVTSSAVTIDNTPPSVSIGDPSPTATNTGPVSFTVTYTGADIVNLTNADVSVNPTGGAAGTVDVTNGTTASPTVTISATTGDGTLGISIASGTAADAIGNEATAAGPSSTFVVDNTQPTISLSSGALDPTGSPIAVSVTLSESSSDFASGDVTLSNATISDFSGGGTSYTFTLIPGAPGLFSAQVDAGTFSDEAGNTNPASNEVSRTYAPSEVYVDFGFAGTELGTLAQPYNTLAEGVAAVAVSGTVKITGDTSEQPRITKAVRIEATAGASRVGSTAKKRALNDSDGDGIPDWWELRHGLNPKDPSGDNGASGDPDSDGYTNADEYLDDTDPLLNGAKSLPAMGGIALIATTLFMILILFGRTSLRRLRRYH